MHTGTIIHNEIGSNNYYINSSAFVHGLEQQQLSSHTILSSLMLLFRSLVLIMRIMRHPIYLRGSFS
jgi:hypothetical protein